MVRKGVDPSPRPSFPTDAAQDQEELLDEELLPDELPVVFFPASSGQQSLQTLVYEDALGGCSEIGW